MPGMDCWAGDFAAVKGRESLENQLKNAKQELNKYKTRYDELNADNLKKQAEERA